MSPAARKIGLIFLIMIIWASAAQSQYSLNGYLKNFFVIFRQPNIPYGMLLGLPEQGYLGSVNQRVRLQSNFRPTHWVNFQVDYDLSLRVQDSLLFAETVFFNTIDPLDYRVRDLQRKVFGGGGNQTKTFGILQNLDRLNAEIHLPFADLYVGRQAIAWGSARVLNPTDVIAPFTFDELDKEERIGVDAFRLRVPLGMMGELDAGYVFGKEWRVPRSALYTRLKVYQFQSDISFLLLKFRENLLLGMDLARSIGGAGFWLETAYVFAETFSQTKSASATDYLRLTLGADYSLTGETYGFVEYHYNGAGEDRPEKYIENIGGIAYREGAVYLLGTHYLIPGIIHQLHPLLTLTVQGMINIMDQSLYLSPVLEYNAAQNIYLSAGAFVGLGKSPGRLGIRSEFGTYPDTFFTSFRFYF
ncbi:MAG: hypothetical protein Kow0042_26270 [Calditrichia bacterium]